MQDLPTFFRTLADRKRFGIVEFLAAHDEVTVTQLGEELRVSQPLMSWHLRRLRRAGIVKTRRSGRQVWCSLNRRVLARYQEQVNETFGLSATFSQETDRHFEPAGHR